MLRTVQLKRVKKPLESDITETDGRRFKTESVTDKIRKSNFSVKESLRKRFKDEWSKTEGKILEYRDMIIFEVLKGYLSLDPTTKKITSSITLFLGPLMGPFHIISM